GWLAALVDGVLVGARADAPGRPAPRPNRTYRETTRGTTVIRRQARRRQWRAGGFLPTGCIMVHRTVTRRGRAVVAPRGWLIQNSGSLLASGTLDAWIWRPRYSPGTDGRPVIFRGERRTPPRGPSWSARSCCSRHPWPGSSRGIAPGWPVGRPRRVGPAPGRGG